MISVSAFYTAANANLSRTPVYRLTFATGEEFSTHPIKANYEDVVMALSPRGYWRLNESGGTTATDSSGNALDLTYHGTSTFGATGPLTKSTSGKAVTFNGTTQYADHADTASLDFGAATAFSLAIWFKTSTKQDKALISKGQAISGSEAGYELYLRSSGSGQLQFATAGAGGANQIAFAYGTAYNDSVWHLIVATRTTGGAMAIYYDGALVASNAGNTVDLSNARSFGIGARATGPSDLVAASLSEAKVFASALSAANVQAIYDAGLMRYNRAGVSAYMDPPRGIISQVNPDRGQASIATTSVVIRDRNAEVTALLTDPVFGTVVELAQGFDDIREADYLTRSFIIGGFRLTKDLGSYEFSLRSAFSLTDKTIFETASTTLTSSCTDSDNTFNVVDTSLFRAISATEYRYIIIDDEIIGISDKTATTFLGTGTLPVVRGAFGTVAAAHDIDADVREMIRLYGHPMDLMQQIMTNTDKTGCSIASSLVKASAFAAIKTSLGPFIKFDLRIRSKENAAQFLEDEFYQVLACYPVITADGKLSIKQFATPVSGVDTITHDNIVADKDGKPLLSWDANSPSITNAVSYNYDEDVFTQDLPTKSDPVEDSTSISDHGRIPLVIPSRGLRTYRTYSDAFTRANSNSLGSDWTESEGAAGDIKIASNRLVLGDAAATSYGIAMWARAAVGRDQYSELTFVSQTVTGESGPAVRMSGSATSFTGFSVVYIATGPALQFKSYNGVNLNAAGGTGGTSYPVTLVPGDVVGIRADGETLYMYLNGVEVASMATDFSGAEGEIGAVLRKVANASTVWETWSGGDNSGDTADLLDTLGQLFIDRYAGGGANIVKCPTYLSKHLLEAGDVVSVTSALLPNLSAGTRGITSALYEVTQSQMNADRGNVALELLSVG